MLPFLTKNVPEPWTNNDIENYCKNGSQRDSVIYNSALNSRVLHLEKNYYQFSVKDKKGDYKNIYLCGIKRNLFYFIIYLPQMDLFNDEHIMKSKMFGSIVSKLPLCSKFYNSFLADGKVNIDLNTEVSISAPVIFVRVNANINEFLFPYSKIITNTEIKRKYALLNLIFSQIANEYSILCNAVDQYNQKVDAYEKAIQEKIQQQKEMLKRMLIRKGVLLTLSLTGVPCILFDTLGDAADIVDVLDLCNLDDISNLLNFDSIVDAIEVADYDNISLIDLSDVYLGDIPDYSDIDYNILGDSYNPTFGNKELPSEYEIVKKAGTSDTFKILKGNKTIADNISGGDTTIKINNIKYNLPDLKHLK